jgi:hypothetical protein
MVKNKKIMKYLLPPNIVTIVEKNYFLGNKKFGDGICALKNLRGFNN